MRAVRRWVDRIGFVGLSGGVLVSGFLQGVYALSLRVEIAFVALAVVLLQATLSSVVFSGFVLVSGGAFLYKASRHRRRLRRRALPDPAGTITAIVPVYRDAAVLHRSVESLLDSNYSDLEVVIVVEPGDDPSRRRAAELADAHERVRRLVNTRYPGSKAGAIDHAAEVTESAFVGVFDADEVVDPGFLPTAVAMLEDHDVVQGRTVPQPTGFVESLAYYESVFLSFVAKRFLYLLTGFRVAASRAVLMRREAFEAAGGYDTAMLTEDFDFAYRCYRERLEVAELLACPSRIDAAHSLRDWWGQRKRWMTGYVQVLHKLARRVEPTDYRSVLSVLLCAGVVAGSALLLSLLSKFAVLFAASAREVVSLSTSGYSIHYVVRSQQVFLLPVFAVFAVTGWTHLWDYRSGAVDRFGWYWVAMPVLFPLYGFAALKAVFEYALSWSGEWYAVEKVPENL